MQSAVSVVGEYVRTIKQRCVMCVRSTGVRVHKGTASGSSACGSSGSK